MSMTGAAFDWRRIAQLTLIVLLAARMGLVGPAGAETAVADDTPLSGWRVNGVTYAVRVVGNVVYVGGSFSQATAPDGRSEARANLAAFDATTGALITGFRADTNGTVRALASDGSTLWVGGSYNTIGGATRHRLAAVDAASGAVKSNFRANTNSNVYALDYRAGRLFVGGSFSTVGGVSRPRAASVNPASGAVESFNPRPDKTVLAVRANSTGTRVYLGGDFLYVNGTARKGVAVVNGSDGAVLSPTFRYSYSPTLGLDLDVSETVLYGAAASSGNQVQAWDANTGSLKWYQKADGDVQAVAVHGEVVYFGFHESFLGDTRLRLLAADATTGSIHQDFKPSFDKFYGVRALSVSDQILAVGGDFTQVGEVAAQGIVRFPIGAAPPPSGSTTVGYTSASSTWHYLDQGVAPEGGWTANGFDTTGWGSGGPQLGYGDGDETTVVSYGPSSSSKYITTYFRTTFSVDALPTGLTVSLMSDDGAVVYVNGVEVVRDNMPSGTIGNSTLASSTRDGSAESAFRSFTISPSLLMAGTNTVAAEVHQAYASSSDISFDLRLSGEVPA